MDAPPSIVIGLEGLIKHSLPRIIKIRTTASAMTNFGRLSPFLKRLQVSVLLLGSIYHKLSQYDMIPGSDMCLGVCHDSLVQTQGMIEAVLQAEDGDNVYKVGAEVLVERLPEEINSFISSVELLRSTYHEAQSEFILESMRELTNLRRDYSKHLQDCTKPHVRGPRPAIVDASSEDEQTSGSDNGTHLTEPEISPPLESSKRKPMERELALADNTAIMKKEPSHYVLPEAHAASTESSEVEQQQTINKEAQSRPKERPSCAIAILSQKEGSTMASKLARGRAIMDTAREENWVSLAMLTKANLAEKITSIEQNDEQGELSTYNGHTLKRQGTVELTWSLEREGKESKAETALFSVFDNLPVDAIIRKGHINESKGPTGIGFVSWWILCNALVLLLLSRF